MKNCLVLAIMLILLSTSAFALTATSLSGMIQMGLESVPTTFQKSIGVKNENNISVDVIFTPSPEIKDMIVMETYNVTLAANETRFVKFNLTVTEMKMHTGSVIIVFTDPSLPADVSQDQFAVSTALIVYPINPVPDTNESVPANTTEENISSVPINTTSNETEVPSDKPVVPTNIIILAAAIILVIAAAIIIINMRKGAKNE